MVVLAMRSISNNGRSQDCKWLFTIENQGEGALIKPAKRADYLLPVAEDEFYFYMLANITLQFSDARSPIVFAKTHAVLNFPRRTILLSA